MPMECQVVDMRSLRNFSIAWSSSGVYSISWVAPEVGWALIMAAFDPLENSGWPAATSPAKLSMRRIISRCFLYIQKCFF